MTRTPLVATYRLQLRTPESDPSGGGFTFSDAQRIIPYLAQLGVSHLYLSPILQAASASSHGYDVVDPTHISLGLGGRTGLEALAHAAHEHGLGIVVDIVPNHMGVEIPSENKYWWDTLMHGRTSQHAFLFDIDWTADSETEATITLPVLESDSDLGLLTIVSEPSGVPGESLEPVPLLAYHSLRFPIAPHTLVTAAGEETIDITHADVRAVHNRQHYRLVPWRDGIMGYRRFFTVSGLAGVRQEDPRVFDFMHQEILSLVEAGVIDGLRIDHPDGLSNPIKYISTLRREVGDDVWIVLEKILSVDEKLDPSFEADGTTGYDVLRLLDGIFVDNRGEPALSSLAARYEGFDKEQPSDSITQQVQEIKRELSSTEFRPELNRLTRAILSEAHPQSGVIPHDDLIFVLRELLARVPYYRQDYPLLAGCLERTINNLLNEKPELKDLGEVARSTLCILGEASTRFAQLSGALTAKAMEDALFYRLTRLVSLQEVGGDPSHFGVSASEFHAIMTDRARTWPKAMTTLTTHDTKRGADVRARISMLSQLPQLWARSLDEWESKSPAPHPDTAAFLWQSFLGVWPQNTSIEHIRRDLEFRKRLHQYATKAAREAGLHTQWSHIDPSFENALSTWIDRIIDGSAGESMTLLVEHIAPHGRINSLGMALFHLMAPGVPDIYQGTEVWEDSLVDPDSRRSISFAELQKKTEDNSPILPTSSDGRAKLALTHAALSVRRALPASFVGGDYKPVGATGAAAENVVGFARGSHGGQLDVVALATRFSERLATEGWGDTVVHLPHGSWTDRLSHRRFTGSVPASQLFAAMPVALLVHDDAY